MEFYKDKLSGKYYRLVKTRDSGINSYLEVDKNNEPLIFQLSCFVHPTTKVVLINTKINLDRLIKAN